MRDGFPCAYGIPESRDGPGIPESFRATRVSRNPETLCSIPESRYDGAMGRRHKVRPITRLDVRHLRNHARRAIGERLRYAAPEALRAVERDGRSVVIRLNSGGNALAVESYLRLRGYKVKLAGSNPDGYGCAVRVDPPGGDASVFRCADCGHGEFLWAWAGALVEGPLGADGHLAGFEITEEDWLHEDSIDCQRHPGAEIEKLVDDQWCRYWRCPECEGKPRQPWNQCRQPGLPPDPPGHAERHEGWRPVESAGVAA